MMMGVDFRWGEEEGGRRRRRRRKEGLRGFSFAGMIRRAAVFLVDDGALTLSWQAALTVS